MVQRHHGTVNIGQANITQAWNEIKDQIDFPMLAKQLETLRVELRKVATTPDEDKAVAAIGEAQEAAEKGDGETMLEKLSIFQKIKKAGMWALDVAEKIAVGLAVVILKKGLGL